MASGKIPLIDAEALSIVAAFKEARCECLPVFLMPPSEQEYAQRVAAWLRETPRALDLYEISARRQAVRVTEVRCARAAACVALTSTSGLAQVHRLSDAEQRISCKQVSLALVQFVLWCRCQVE